MSNLYTFITVAHNIDQPLLKLQGRSLNRYLDRSMVKEVLIIDNSVNEKLDLNQVIPQYGSLPVKVITANEVANITIKTYGWITQQILKLMISKQVTTKKYVLLDSKIQLLRPLTIIDLESPDGKIRSELTNFHGHPLEKHLINCCNYLSIDPLSVINGFLPTTPPFIMITDIAKQLINDIESKENCSFAETFLKNQLTEFFLYSCYILSIGKKLEDYYTFDNVLRFGLWGHYNNASMQSTIKDALDVPFLSVHRRCYKNMDNITIKMLAQLWYNQNLFSSYQDAERFVKGCAITYK